ncbi:hypothetical protein BZA05DRAFT_394398 [Tricharina praecox]|uniref:uncharacterized protein n=1 Tax=Tricharina praecox TaxID=43433 RepID=UPI00221F6F1A|nr:uncharacterized protein BZA05DRAFT_394398 [Tricharina praecox]KAI5853700.1 hypothetical protein BZA05DRAFT_394398 [Tricharina praecox]
MKIPALQRPIAKPKPKERIAPFRLPRETPVSSSRPRASQTITETPTDVRDHPDTDFNAHLLLGDGGYIRFGRGRPEANHSMDAYVPHCPSHSRVSDPFGLNSRTDRQEREVYEQSTPRGSSHFQSVQSSPPRSMSSRTERRNRELDEQRLQSTPREGSYFQSVQSSAPRSMNFRELFPDGHPIGPPRAGARLLSRQVAADFHTSQAYEDTDAEVDYGSFLPRRNRVEQWPLSHSQSSPTTHIGHYVSQEIDREYIVVDEDEYEEIFAEESELPDSINPSAMAHASSSNDTLRHENEEQSGFNGTFLGTPPPENTEKNWMVFLNASPVRGSQENQDGISTFVHGRTVTETEVNDDPTQPFFGSEALGEQVDALDGPSDDTPVDEDERPVTSVPRKVDNDATWKKFLTASTEVTSRNALTLNALDISGDLNMLSAPKTPIPESPPARLSPTRDVNRAWHAFILPTYPDSDDDEDYAPKSLDGRQYTALTSTQNAGSLSMSTGPISLPRLPSRSPKGPSRPSPSTNTEKAVAESGPPFLIISVSEYPSTTTISVLKKSNAFATTHREAVDTEDESNHGRSHIY